MTGSRELPTFLWDAETNQVIYDALPQIFVDFLALFTRLGDGATVVTLAIVFYWFGGWRDWRKRGMLMAIAVMTLAMSAGLKGVFDVSRPVYVAELAFAPETYPGLSTPSAHAMGAAAIYGGLAVVMETGKRWQRYLVAGVIITLVALSRVVIGVHFLGDVVLGAALGLFIIWFAIWLANREPRSILSMFMLAFLFAVSAILLGSEEFVTMSTGAALGGVITWSLIHDRQPKPIGGAIILFGILLVPALLIFRVIEALIVFDVTIIIAGIDLPIMAWFRTAGYAALFGLALAVPVLAERFNDHRHALYLQRVLPFTGRTIDPERVSQQVDQLDD